MAIISLSRMYGKQWKKNSEIKAYVVDGQNLKEIQLKLGDMTDTEREIILKGCLINYYRNEGNIQQAVFTITEGDTEN